MLLKFDQNIKFHTKQGEEKYFTHKKIVCLVFFFLDGSLVKYGFIFLFFGQINFFRFTTIFFFVVVSCNWPFYVQHDDYSVILEIVGFFFPDVVLNRMENVSRVLKWYSVISSNIRDITLFFNNFLR